MILSKNWEGKDEMYEKLDVTVKDLITMKLMLQSMSYQEFRFKP